METTLSMLTFGSYSWENEPGFKNGNSNKPSQYVILFCVHSSMFGKGHTCTDLKNTMASSRFNSANVRLGYYRQLDQAQKWPTFDQC